MKWLLLIALLVFFTGDARAEDDVDYPQCEGIPYELDPVRIVKRIVIVALEEQRVYFVENNKIVCSAMVSTGKEKHETSVGTFRVTRKIRHHRSKETGSIMLFAAFFDEARGIAFHLGRPNGEPASMGCVRLNPADAYFAFHQFVRVGDVVVVK